MRPVAARLLLLALPLVGCDGFDERAHTRLESDGPASGFRVAVDGQTALVASSSRGPAAVYEREPEGWSRTADLLPDDVDAGPTSRDRYGWAVALSGDVAVIGAHGADGGRGAAYVFERRGGEWGEPVRLQPAGLTEASRFGTAVATDGDRVFVSSIGTGADAVSVYEWDGAEWSVSQTIEGADRTVERFFGNHLATEAGQLVVTSVVQLSDGAEPLANGVVYVFRLEGARWVREARVESGIPYDDLDGLPGRPRSDGLGPVDIDGEVIVAGAPYLNAAAGRSAGAVLVFERIGGEWRKTARLISNDADVHDNLGRLAVVVEGDVIVAPSDFQGGTGVVYTFERSGGAWAQVDKLTEHDEPQSQGFGTSVGLDGGTLIVGAPYEAGEDGAAYVYRRSGAGWVR